MHFRPFKVLVNIEGYVHKTFAKKFDIFIIVYLNTILIYNKDLT